MNIGSVQQRKRYKHFSKGAWKTPTNQMRAKRCCEEEVVTQLLVFSLKPMTAGKRAADTTGDKYETARLGLQGQNHEGFQV